MMDSSTHPLHEQYTGLADRFRSLWTFYQFLGGVFKHLGRGQLTFHYDFQRLHRRLQDALPQIGLEDISPSRREFEQIEAELQKIHRELAQIEEAFAPSLLRRFFDHLKRQDQKILFALVKFYLMARSLEQDHLDKLDMLLTRLAEAPSVDEVGGMSDLRTKLDRLAQFGGIEPVAEEAQGPLLEQLRQLNAEINTVEDFQTMMESGVLDRFRRFKHELGRTFLAPPVVAEIIATNLVAKRRFRKLYEEEEVRILEDTNRILEIERYIERNPDMAHPELREQIETFKQHRVQFDSGRKDDNVKRDDVVELRQSMHRILDSFDGAQGDHQAQQAAPAAAAPPAPAAPPEPAADPFPVAEVNPDVTATPLPVRSRDRGFFADRPTRVAEPPAQQPFDIGDTDESVEATSFADDHTEILSEPLLNQTPAVGDQAPLLHQAGEGNHSHQAKEAPSLAELLTPPQLIVEAFHKIVFALEISDRDLKPEHVVQCQGLQHLRLEPLEVQSYREMVEQTLVPATLRWELARFCLLGAALRVKMEEELAELLRLNPGAEGERLQRIADEAGQSLEQGTAFQQRFQWFVDDMLYRGDTEHLALFARVRYRFLSSFSRLWLELQARGGSPPL